ncbi:MAG: exodeoxyribonuclease VII small subunit [Oscillospiraceae bacterium]|nr:exodeoxyribonuclease VII small subunit [Oscillospiraceae bacterium]MDY4586289.1 exodeoxyribonuclease VII small subunit [Oscillospiraceae bacterium]
MEQTFESAMSRLEEISDVLSQNQVGLDESLKLYEEGVKLLKFCSDKLEKADITIKRIEEEI